MLSEETGERNEMDEHTTDPQETQQTQQTENMPDGEATMTAMTQEMEGLRQLVTRLLSQQFGYAGATEKEPQLLVGRIPLDFPIALPLPDDTHIIGSVVSRRLTSIMYDTQVSSDDVMDLYYQRMAALGWEAVNMPTVADRQQARMQHGGFQHNSRRRPTNHYEIFMKDEQGPGLTVTTGQAPDGLTSVQVGLHTYEHPEQSPLFHRRYGLFSMIPPLYPPEGDYQRSGGGSSGNGAAHTTATLTSGLDLPAVAAHYNAQLREAGWVSSSDGGTGKEAAWSVWRFTDKDGQPWQGIFIALTHPDTPHDYFLVVQARSTTKEGDSRLIGSSWTSYGPM
jgi:hypothetical protein